MPLDFPPSMTGAINVKVRDASGTETQFIQVGKPFTVELDWTVKGPGTVLGNPTNQWHVRARLESVGPPPFEAQLVPEQVTNFVPVDGHPYQVQITPAVPVPGLGEGVYELAVVLDLRRQNGTRLPVHGFVDGIQLDFFS